MSRDAMVHRGYDVISLGFFNKSQYWWNENNKTCVSVSVEDRKIVNFSSIPNKKCEWALATLPKNRLDYFAGSAPVRNEQLDSERVKLYAQGLKPVYWIKSPVLDRSIEYWVSANCEMCKHLIFETIGGRFVSIGNDELRQCLFIGRANI